VDEVVGEGQIANRRLDGFGFGPEHHGGTTSMATPACQPLRSCLRLRNDFGGMIAGRARPAYWTLVHIMRHLRATTSDRGARSSGPPPLPAAPPKEM